MRKLLRNALVTGATAAAAVGLVGAPAQADTRTWNVSPESTFTATSTNSVLTNRSAQLRCVTVTANGEGFSAPDAGTVHATSPSKGHTDVLDTVAEVTSSTWTTCTGPFNLTFTVTQKGTWELQARYQNGTRVYGRITNVVANISGPLCTAQIVGSAEGYYDNATGQLVINETGSGQLTVQPGASCLGVLVGGDHPTFNATFSVSPAFTINNLP